MIIRQPIVAGRFYPGETKQLKEEVTNWRADKDNKQKPGKPWGVMLPHAGYVYCGNVMGQTLAGQTLPSHLIILCPNHTGRGKMLSVWPEGQWLTPLGNVSVDENLARAIIDSHGGFEEDTFAHGGEHSIEVILPFLQVQIPHLSIVPICVGTQNPVILAMAGKALAAVLKGHEDTGLVISSDMNHYENEKLTIVKDNLALEKALAVDPDGLLEVVKTHGISMCGAGPLALALYAAKDLGKVEVEIVAHDTSGNVSGDYEHTVGYAGLRIYLAA